MLTSSKLKKTLLAAGLILAFSTSHANAACMPWNPICIFKMILKSSPGMPVFDFVSVPAIIPHIPAALLKEGQAKIKEEIDNKLNKVRSAAGVPSDAKISVKTADFSGSTHSDNEEFASLEAFPKMDGDDPMEIAKAIEVIFLRPGWNDKEAKYTQYDSALMRYYQGKFEFNNAVEVIGFTSYMQAKADELMVMMEDIQKQVDAADDLNKAQRANYAAHLMEYQLMILQNQLAAVDLQMQTSGMLKGTVLDRPVFGDLLR